MPPQSEGPPISSDRCGTATATDALSGHVADRRSPHHGSRDGACAGLARQSRIPRNCSSVTGRSPRCRQPWRSRREPVRSVSNNEPPCWPSSIRCWRKASRWFAILSGHFRVAAKFVDQSALGLRAGDAAASGRRLGARRHRAHAGSAPRRRGSEGWGADTPPRMSRASACQEPLRNRLHRVCPAFPPRLYPPGWHARGDR